MRPFIQSSIAFLLIALIVVACDALPAPEPTSDPNQTPVPESASAEEEILTERTPVPTATPDRITRAIAAASGGTSAAAFGLTTDELINLGVSILIVIGGMAIGSLLIRLILPRLARRAPLPYDKRIEKDLAPKLRLLLLVYLLRVATIRLTFLNAGLKRALTDAYFIVALIVSTQIIMRLIDLAFDYYLDRLEPEERKAQLTPVVSLVLRLTHAVVIVLAVSAGLSRFGINITALAAALGIAGLGFALAAQDTIADAIAGILILADQPFRVGDRIEIEAVKTWGDVIQIGLRTTRIRTRDNRLVIIPNSTISKNEVINYSYPDPRYRIETHVGIANGTDIEVARKLMIETVGGVDGVLQDLPVEALYIEMAEFDMRFRVRWWIDSYVDTRRMFDKIHTALQNALDEAGIVQPYPIRELHHRLSSEQEEQFSDPLRIRETRRNPRTSNTPPSDADPEDSGSRAQGG